MRLLIPLLALAASACVPVPPPAPYPPPPWTASRGPMFPLPLRLVGTEPFWGGRITHGEITLSGADRPDMRFPAGEPTMAGVAMRWRTQSTGALPLELTVTPARCSDGMSDRVYPYEATAVLGRETLKGCAGREELFQRGG